MFVVAIKVVFKNRRTAKYSNIASLKKEFIDTLKDKLYKEGMLSKYGFFVTESRGVSLYCYLVDKENDRGAMVRISDHKADVYAEDIDLGTIFYSDCEDLGGVVDRLCGMLTQGELPEQVKLTISEFKALEYLLYANLTGFGVRMKTEKKGSATYLIDIGLDMDNKYSTIQVENFFKFTKLHKLGGLSVDKNREDLLAACKVAFHDIVNLKVVRSLISKGMLTLYREDEKLDYVFYRPEDVYKVNLNAKGYYYVSSVGLGVDVLRGLSLSTWFTKYSLDLLFNSKCWRVREEVGEVKWVM